MMDERSTRGRTVALTDQRKHTTMTTTTDTRRLQQLRAAIDDTLADPDDRPARRDAGRLACTVGLLLLDERDDRGVLMLDLIADGLAHAAPSSSTTTEAHR